MFKIPNLASLSFDAGAQPLNPGQTPSAFFLTPYTKKPWPGIVDVLRMLANNPGVPTSRAPVPVVNQYAVLPDNNLFIGGFVGKSQG